MFLRRLGRGLVRCEKDEIAVGGWDVVDLLRCVLDAELAGEEALGALGAIGGFYEVELGRTTGIVADREGGNDDTYFSFLQLGSQAIDVVVDNHEDGEMCMRLAAKDRLFEFPAGFQAVDDSQTNGDSSSCN